MILRPFKNPRHVMHFTLAFSIRFNDVSTKWKKQRYEAANESNICAVFYYYNTVNRKLKLLTSSVLGSFAQGCSPCPAVMTLDVLISLPTLCLEHWLGHIHTAQQDAGKESWKKKQFFFFFISFWWTTKSHGGMRQKLLFRGQVYLRVVLSPVS